MDGKQHTILCVDDEPNVLSALKRLLRKEPIRVLTAQSGAEGLTVLAEEVVHLVISDQRMPEMSGTEFLARVKALYPDIVRITLTGYTEVDSITDSINKGHIYKFFLKPWNDQNLKLEIRQALEQYDLVQQNKRLHQTVLEQNHALKEVNENLEALVEKRSGELAFRNRALELSQSILEHLPVAVVGVSTEFMIVLANRTAVEAFSPDASGLIGKHLEEIFPAVIRSMVTGAPGDGATKEAVFACGTKHYRALGAHLSGKFADQGIVLTLVGRDDLHENGA